MQTILNAFAALPGQIVGAVTAHPAVTGLLGLAVIVAGALLAGRVASRRNRRS